MQLNIVAFLAKLVYNLSGEGENVGKKEKLIARIKSVPKDFTFNEMQNLLELLGFKKYSKGKTSGSRIQFKKENMPIYLHKPHPRKELLEYQVRQVLEVLEKEKLI